MIQLIGQRYSVVQLEKDLDSSGQTSGHGNCDYPGDDDVAEKRPVDGLFGADAAGEDDGADFAVGC